MTTKVIPERIVHDSCHNCPYSEYDSYYSMSTDSGYDCNHEEGGRIATDGMIDSYRRKVEEAERLPLFPEEVTEPNPMSIPDWCPLEDKE